MRLVKKAYEVVASEIERQIESGTLVPGGKLDTIDVLAKRFHVGRSTIREALGLLKARGLVHSVQGGGTYVATNVVQEFEEASSAWLTSTTEFAELLQVRKMLEVGSIALAASSRSEQDIAELSRIVEAMKHSVGHEERSQVYDVNFHLAIAKAAHNQLLMDIMQSLGKSMSEAMRVSRKLWLYRESAESLLAEHQLMLTAIQDGHSALAAQTMAQHLDRVLAAFSAAEQ